MCHQSISSHVIDDLVCLYVPVKVYGGLVSSTCSTPVMRDDGTQANRNVDGWFPFMPGRNGRNIDRYISYTLCLDYPDTWSGLLG